MSIRALAGAALLAATGVMGGCASEGNFLADSLTTSSINSTAKAQPSIDPQCVALMSKIDALRKEGTPERIEKVSTGKTATAVVKREALQRMTELDKANAEFQSRCSTLSAGQQAAATPTGGAAKVAATDGAKQSAVKTVAKQAPKATATAQ